MTLYPLSRPNTDTKHHWTEQNNCGHPSKKQVTQNCSPQSLKRKLLFQTEKKISKCVNSQLGNVAFTTLDIADLL